MALETCSRVPSTMTSIGEWSRRTRRRSGSSASPPPSLSWFCVVERRRLRVFFCAPRPGSPTSSSFRAFIGPIGAFCPSTSAGIRGPSSSSPPSPLSPRYDNLRILCLLTRLLSVPPRAA